MNGMIPVLLDPLAGAICQLVGQSYGISGRGTPSIQLLCPIKLDSAPCGIAHRFGTTTKS
jgi:hypothetical protein